MDAASRRADMILTGSNSPSLAIGGGIAAVNSPVKLVLSACPTYRRTVGLRQLGGGGVRLFVVGGLGEFAGFGRPNGCLGLAMA